MATITINIPETKVTLAELANAFAVQYGYKDTISGEDGIDIPNPESKGDFAKRHVLEYIKKVFISYKINEAEKTARADANAQARADIEEVNAA